MFKRIFSVFNFEKRETKRKILKIPKSVKNFFDKNNANFVVKSIK